MTIEYHFYNFFHYGDNILNLKFLKNIVSIVNIPKDSEAQKDSDAPLELSLQKLETPSIVIYYYYNQYYNTNRKEFEVYIGADAQTYIHLRPMEEKPAHAINLWIGQYQTINGIHFNVCDTYFNLYYKNILTMMQLSNLEINTSLYQDDPRIIERYNQLPDKYKNVGILILNTYPQSNQVPYHKQEWDELCCFLALKHKIVTAHHVHSDIECTLRDGLTLQDIGAISTHCTYIIGIHSGPMAACYTSYTKKSVKKWFVFCINSHHEEIDVIDHCTMPQVYEYFR